MVLYGKSHTAEHMVSNVLQKEAAAQHLFTKRDVAAAMQASFLNVCLQDGGGFNFHELVGVDERADLYQGGGGPDIPEKLAMCADHFLPLADVG